MRSIWVSLKVIVAIALFLLMTLTVADVVGRYVFNTPLPAAYELTKIVMGIVIFSALPLTTLRQKHIVVGLFDFFFRARKGRRRVQQAAVNFIAMGVIGFVAYQVAVEAASLESANIVTSTLRMPIAPFAFYMAALAGVTAIVLAYICLRHALGRTNDRDRPHGGAGPTL